MKQALPFGSLAAAALCLTACDAPSAGAPKIAIAGEEAALFGDLDTIDCSLDEREALAEAHLAGMKIAVSEAFDACLTKRMYGSYLPCWDGSGDPFINSSRDVQFQKAQAIMQSGNTADVTVTCKKLDDGANANADVDGYGDNHESLNMDRGYIDAKLTSEMSDYQRADLAGTIWHESMHQQGYRHDDCGYPDGQYQRGFNSVPYISDRCMRSAGTSARVIASAADKRAQSLGIGRSLASQGQLGGVGDDTIASFILGPATSLRYCRDEASPDPNNCNTVTNATTEYSSPHNVPSTFANAISFVQVDPLALFFSGTNYQGNVQAFAVGEHRADTGDFSIVGNDSTRSIYLSPGARVRVCSDEGGTTGHGYWSCALYDRSTPSGLIPGISYAEVRPVVTAFTESDLYGSSQSYGSGRYAGAGLGSVGDDKIVSLVVPDGLVARVCSDVGSSQQGTGGCQTHTRSTFDLGGGLARAVSFIEVTPYTLGTSQLTVSRAADSGPGHVTSSPLGLDCQGPCTASFETRSEVRLTAASAHYAVTWTGCDRTETNSCYVTMMGARTVSVGFKAVVDPQCYSNCFKSCRADGVPAATCAKECKSDCMP